MRTFRRLAVSTLVAVYVLILVGGIVRSTGSGMGCPDWPKCFGSWVPPSSVAELPSDYKQAYSEYRHKKNQKFATYLRFIGMSKTADRLLADKSVLQEADFNPTKTWIEYLNRIVGVIIGILIFAVAVASFQFLDVDRPITVVAVLTFLLVSFQGWLGSFVVSSNLTPWTVTVHMFLALVIVALLVYLIAKTHHSGISIPQTGSFWLVLVCIATLLVQILLGTGLREAVDGYAMSDYPRESWLSQIGSKFIVHRTFSWIVLLFHIGLIVNLRKTQGPKPFPLTLIVLILGTILTGAGMAWFAIPPILQPLHLLLATITFGMQFLLLLRLKGNVKPVFN
jgi:heme a synthase